MVFLLNLFTTQTDKTLFRWHQDVRPENILVVSGGAQSPHEWKFKLADLGISHFIMVSSSRENSTASDAYGTRTYGMFHETLADQVCTDSDLGAPECFRPDEASGRATLKIHQEVDIWSLGCIFSEAVRWLPLRHRGVVDYTEERKAEINAILAFDGVDCFHDGQKVLGAVHKSNEIARQSLLRRDFITDKVIEMIDDMLAPAGDRPNTHFLWKKQLRILERARQNLASQLISQESNIYFPPRLVPEPHHTHPVQGLSTSPRMPPVLPLDFRQEIAIRPAVHPTQLSSRGPPHIQADKRNSTVLGDQKALLRYSPDPLTEIGDEKWASSPSSRISAETASQYTSPVPSPSQQSPYEYTNYPYQNQSNLEDVIHEQVWGPASTVHRQGSRNSPRGTSQMSASANIRNSALAATISQSTNTNQGQEQRQDLPIQVLSTKPTDPPSPLQRQQEQPQQQHTPRPAVGQNPESHYLSLQDALIWRTECKDTKTHVQGLANHLLNRLKDRDHVRVVFLSLYYIQYNIDPDLEKP